MASGFSLKDELFNAETVGFLAGQFAGTGAVDGPALQARIMARLPQLELKERIAWIADCLCEDLPQDLPTAAPVLLEALPPPLDPSRTDDDFGSFIIAPWGAVVERLGLEHPDLSLDLLKAITQRFSMEYSIRPFIAKWPDLVLERLRDWTAHENYHVRRLVSEGTRPRLPWAQNIPIAIDVPLPLLDRLHGDPTRFVTRSVANHLNDISKQQPDLALSRLERWREAGMQEPDELRWMTTHALRGLVKSGDPKALAMIGFDPDAPIDVTRFDLPKKAAIGDHISLDITLQSAEDSGALVDYIFWRRRANGKLAPKVHKLKKLNLQANTPTKLSKQHHLKGDATTYSLYPGLHRISLQINGKIRAEAEFELTT